MSSIMIDEYLGATGYVSKIKGDPETRQIFFDAINMPDARLKAALNNLLFEMYNREINISEIHMEKV